MRGAIREAQSVAIRVPPRKLLDEQSGRNQAAIRPQSVYLLESSGPELKVLDERVAQIREIVETSTRGELPLRILHLVNELSLMRETISRNESLLGGH